MSKYKAISQREARALKKRVAELEDAEDRRRNAWIYDYPGGVHIGSMAADLDDRTKVIVARKLGHAVVCVAADGVIRLYALPLSSRS